MNEFKKVFLLVKADFKVWAEWLNREFNKQVQNYEMFL